MTKGSSVRGGVPVGMLVDLPPVEVGAVLYLRAWSEGPEAQAQVWNDFATVLGPDAGRAALKAFEQLYDLCLRYGRRPLMRHHLGCVCLGADEACFANLVAAATEGQREDAMLIATLLVRPDMAPGLVALAESFGIAVRRIAQSGDRPRESGHPQNSTIH